MSAVIQKNQATALLRECDMWIVDTSTNLGADRGTSFTGYVYVGSSSTMAAGVGTLTNKRRALVVADDTFTAAATDICTATAHGLQTGDGPIRLTSSGTLPAGLALATDYWVIKIDADTFYLATSLANAYAATRVDITDTGSGTHTLSDTASTARGIDGWWKYQFTQTETNVTGCELVVQILGHASCEGHTTCDLVDEGGTLATVIEGSLTMADVLRILLRGEIAPYSIAAGVYTVRDVADTKDSHHGTITGSGRSSTAIDDAS